MTISQTQRKEALAESPDSIFDLFNEPAIGRIIKNVTGEHNLAQAEREKMITVIGDTILGFYQTKDLPSLLQKETGLSADAAQRVVANLAELLSPVLERERMLANPKLGEVKALHQQFSVSGGQPGSAVSAEQAPAEAEEPESVHNVTPMRTMAGDMNRIHGYGAYRQANPAAASEEPVVQAKPQSEILQSRQPLTGVPRLGE